MAQATRAAPDRAARAGGLPAGGLRAKLGRFTGGRPLSARALGNENIVQFVGALLSAIGAFWTFAVINVVWIPAIVREWMPDAWIPDWFPVSALDFLPSWLQWIPFSVHQSLAPLIIPTTILVAPGILLLLAGAKLRSQQ